MTSTVNSDWFHNDAFNVFEYLSLFYWIKDSPKFSFFSTSKKWKDTLSLHRKAPSETENRLMRRLICG